MLKRQLRYVVIGTLLMVLIGIVYSYSLFRLEIEVMYNASKFESGIPYMIALFFFSLFMAIGGYLYSKYDTKKIGFVGVLLISSGFILTSLEHSILLITITYGVIVGTGVGILYGLPLRIVSQLDLKNLGLLTGIVLLGFGLSPLLFAPIINSLIQSQGLNTTFLVLGIGYFVLMLPLVLILTKQDQLQKTSEKYSFSIIREKKFVNLYVLFFLGTFIGLTFIGFTGSIGKELIGLSSNTIALLLGVFAVFNGIGRPLFGYLHDKIGFKATAMLSFACLAIAALLHYIFVNYYLIFIVSFIVFYINFGGWLSLASATTMDLFGKENYSKNYGLMYTAYGVGAIIGNSMSGLMVGVLGLRSLFILMSTIGILGLIITNQTFKSEQKE